MHSYKVLCHYASFLLVADYANIVLIRSGHQNGWFGRGNKKNCQIRGYSTHMACNL